MEETCFKKLRAFTSEINLTDFLIRRVYPAPPALNLMDADIEGLTLEEIKNTLSSEELWQAGNFFLKQNNYLLADSYYELVLKKDKNNFKVEALRGLVQLFLNNYKKAGVIFSKVLISDPSLSEVRLWLSYVRLKEGKSRSVSHNLSLFKNNKIKKHEIGNPKSGNVLLYYILMGMHQINSKKIEEAEKILEKGLSLEDESIIKTILAYIGFLKGSYVFQKGDLKEAILTWVRYAQISKDSWYGVAEIVSFFSSISETKIFKENIKALDDSIDISVSNSSSKEQFYWFIVFKLCGLSLIPEFFEELQGISKSKESWLEKKKSSNSYPYAHYRYALCLLYEGSIDKAYEEIYEVREKIPNSKKTYFKIEQLVELVSDLRTSESYFNSGFEVV